MSHALSCVSVNAFRDEQSISRAEDDISDQSVQRITHIPRGATLDRFRKLSTRGPACFHSQTPKQHSPAKELNNTVNTECFEQQTL
jgi:hypothetical protein